MGSWLSSMTGPLFFFRPATFMFQQSIKSEYKASALLYKWGPAQKGQSWGYSCCNSNCSTCSNCASKFVHDLELNMYHNFSALRCVKN